MREYPPIFREFANYKLAIQNRSKLTVEEYLLDLDQFFRYYLCKCKNKKVSPLRKFYKKI